MSMHFGESLVHGPDAVRPMQPKSQNNPTAFGRGLYNNQTMKNFISAHDVKDIDSLVKSALSYKADPFKDKNLGANKRIGMLFLNPSMRTRLSTQVAAQNLGMEPIIFNVDKEGWALEFEEEAIMSGNTVEHVKDAAPIMGKYFD